MKTFPIQGGWSDRLWRAIPATSIPWDVIAPHEAQAIENHAGQTLEKLASRGGLGHCEAVAVLEDRPWRRMDFEDARAALEALVSPFGNPL